jgi:hypothetical protein
MDNWLPSMGRTVCHSEVCTSGSNCLKAAKPVLMQQTGKERRPSTPTDEQNMERAEAMTLGNCRVTIAEIAAILDINFALPWCKPLE